MLNAGARTCSPGRRCARELRRPLNANATCSVRDSRRCVALPENFCRYHIDPRRWRRKTWSCTVKYKSTRLHRTERRPALRRSSHSLMRLVRTPCALPLQCSQTEVWLSDLREMAGTATGRPANVDASDRRDTKCYQPSSMKWK